MILWQRSLFFFFYNWKLFQNLTNKGKESHINFIFPIQTVFQGNLEDGRYEPSTAEQTKTKDLGECGILSHGTHLVPPKKQSEIGKDRHTLCFRTVSRPSSN